MTATLAPSPVQAGGDPALLWAELRHIIDTTITDDPRSQQRRIGPSELGTPCDRRLGYKLAGVPELNDREPNWKATIGTAVHEWLAGVFYADGRDTGRWAVEQRVTVGTVNGEDIDGSTDLFDTATGTVVDWKVTTCNKIKEYRRRGPGQQYRVQTHAYGRGWAAKGHTVDRVAIVFLPRDGELSQAWMWSEPYDEQVAVAALARANAVAALTAALGPAAPAVLQTADAYCNFCSWYRPASTDLSRSCPGHPGRSEHHGHSELQGLIA